MKNKEKGFKYTLEKEKVKEYQKLSVREKLEWLESINHFNNLFLDNKTKQFQQDLLNGKI
jgi:hypothetical protein